VTGDTRLDVTGDTRLDVTGDTSICVREATTADRLDVLNVLDGANLATDIDRVADALARGDVLVAVADTEREAGDNQRVLGALVLDGEEITAVAVRRRRRDQDIGTALVEAASQRCDRLVARFDPGVRAFWDALGFEIAPLPQSDRYRGVR